MALTTIALNRILQENFLTKHCFKGTYPACYFPGLDTKKSSGWVMNNENHQEPGSHWVLWFYSEVKKTLYFMDSFARNPTDVTFPHSFSHITDLYDNVEYLASPVQGVDSYTCGYFVIHAFVLLAAGFDLESFRLEYGENKMKNDFKVVRIVKSLI